MFTKVEKLKRMLDAKEYNRHHTGIDGLPVEFYRSFWSVMDEDLLEVITNSLHRGFLPLSCRRVVITLLPKKGALCNLKNWQPVSFLCSDCEILSKALGTKLWDMMASVIHGDQTSRLISDNITLIQDILKISSSLDIDIGLIFIDQQKTFDQVKHQYLW